MLQEDTPLADIQRSRDDIFRFKFLPLRGGRGLASWNMTGLSDDRQGDFADLGAADIVIAGLQETHLTAKGQSLAGAPGWQFIWGAPCAATSYSVKGKLGSLSHERTCETLSFCCKMRFL